MFAGLFVRVYSPEPFALEGFSQFWPLEALFQQRLNGNGLCRFCSAAQVISLRVRPLFKSKAALGVHLARDDKLLEALRPAVYVKPLQQIQ